MYEQLDIFEASEKIEVTNETELTKKMNKRLTNITEDILSFDIISLDESLGPLYSPLKDLDSLKNVDELKLSGYIVSYTNGTIYLMPKSVRTSSLKGFIPYKNISLSNITQSEVLSYLDHQIKNYILEYIGEAVSDTAGILKMEIPYIDSKVIKFLTNHKILHDTFEYEEVVSGYKDDLLKLVSSDEKLDEATRRYIDISRSHSIWGRHAVRRARQMRWSLLNSRYEFAGEDYSSYYIYSKNKPTGMSIKFAGHTKEGKRVSEYIQQLIKLDITNPERYKDFDPDVFRIIKNKIKVHADTELYHQIKAMYYSNHNELV